MRILATLMLVSILAGCGTATKLLHRAEGATAELSKVAVEDLAAAEESALRHKDPYAAECWAELRVYVGELRKQGFTDIKGAFTAFQKARNIRRGVQAGLPEAVHVRCAHMFRDARNTLIGLARLVF